MLYWSLNYKLILKFFALKLQKQIALNNFPAKHRSDLFIKKRTMDLIKEKRYYHL